jgi:hypothetical protein
MAALAMSMEDHAMKESGLPENSSGTSAAPHVLLFKTMALLIQT